MAQSILISDPDSKWNKTLKNYLSENKFEVDLALSGRECQLKVYKKKYFSIILDVETQNHSGFEVLKYLRLNHPSVKVILTFKNNDIFKKFEFSKKELRKLGASDIMIKPFSLEMILKSIEGVNQFEAWKNLKSSKNNNDESVLDVNDNEFTRIKIHEFSRGNVNIFDCYIKVSKGKYLKILHCGDHFEAKQLEKYINESKIEYLYFKTKERMSYINFINEILEKSLKKADKSKLPKRFEATKNVTEKYVEEIYTSGIKPQLIDEGKKICSNLSAMLFRDKGLAKLLGQYEEYDKTAYGHLFLVSFFSAIICKNLEWSSTRTIEIVAFGSMFHDIGMLQMPPGMNEMNSHLFTDEEWKLFKNHPKAGVDLLQRYPLISEAVRQIVYQHHEYVNGEGFPNGLSGLKIYPLAKIVSFSDEYSNFLVRNNYRPIEGLKLFISDKERTFRFDSKVITSLIKGFKKDK